MNIAVYGDSTAAITCAAAFAETGNHVTLVPFVAMDEAGLLRQVAEEPGVPALVSTGLQNGTFKLAPLQKTVRDAQVQIFAMQAEQQMWAEQLTATLAESGTQAVTLVVRATFPVGSAERLQARIAEKRSCALVVEPDFLPEGRALSAFKRPDRILLGTTSREAEACMRNLYRPFNRNRDVILVVSPRAAELTKFATNAMLATRVSFMNELAQLAESYGVDIEQVRQGLGMDRRIGFDFLYPGVGFGGPYFARDVQRLAEMMRAQQVDAGLLDAVLDINALQKEALFRKAWVHYDYALEGRIFTLWGVSYKPHTESVINAPSVPLARALLAQGAEIKLYDPAAMQAFMAVLTEQEKARVQPCETPYQALSDSDGLMLVTEWKPFWHPDWCAVKAAMRTPVIFDGRNIYSPERLKDEGFVYYGIGR